MPESGTSGSVGARGGKPPWATRPFGRALLASFTHHERVVVLLATSGPHPFFREEKGVIRDARIVPIKYAGYAVSYCGGHVHVRIEQETYKDLKAYFLDLAAKRS